MYGNSSSNLAPLRYNSANTRCLAPAIVLIFLASGIFILWPTQTEARWPNTIQASNEVRQLELGTSIERELAGGQKHLYQLAIATGRYLKVVVEQKGIDVVVSLSGPDGKQLREVDSPNGTYGPELVSGIFETPGIYQLEVRSLEKDATPGHYEIKVIELRPVTEQDYALEEALRLYNEATSLYSKAKVAEAVLPAERALAIREKVLGANHRDVAIVLNSLGAFHTYLGDQVKAVEFYQRAVGILEKTQGPDNLGFAMALHNLAGSYRERGDYVQAERAYQRALTIMEKILEPGHPMLGTTRMDFARVYRSKGDYERAEPLLKQALAILEKNHGLNYPDVVLAVLNLAAMYCDKGDFVQAEPLLRRILAMAGKTLRENHHYVSNALSLLARIYYEKGDYIQAEPLFARALALYEKELGPDHLDVGEALQELARVHLIKGEYAEAATLLERALKIKENALGPQYPSIAYLLVDIATLYWATERIPQAIDFQRRATDIIESNLAHNLSSGSEREKLIHLSQFTQETNRAITLHLQSAPNNSQARQLAVISLFNHKGRGLDAMVDGIARLRSHATPQDQSLFDQLTTIRSRISTLTFKGPTTPSLDLHQSKLKLLEGEREKLEAEISRRSAEFRSQFQPVTIAAIQSAVPTDAVLIEIASYQPFNTRFTNPKEAFGPPRYAAYLIRNQGEIQWADLGEAGPINQTINNWRNALRDPRKEKEVNVLARVVDEKVMHRLRGLLGDTRRLLISPDGDLNLIPFAALIDENNHYLIENYSISYLTSGRDLLRLQVARASKSNALVMADPAYGDAPAAVAATVHTEEAGDPLATLYFNPLLTGAEADALKSVMPDSLVLKRKDATETALKRVHAPRILHIATHGFFLQTGDSSAESSRSYSLLALPATRSGKSTDALIRKIENPLLRSGLALAGANRRSSGEDDGILTALEVAGLDLWGTKLVVLSACDTGIGEVKNGEGVYGLRRALVLAGAESQAVSLWKVNDAATKDLMVAYYKELMTGKGRAEALRKVQLIMLRDPKRRHPYYWASFIHSGEWANLEGRR